MRSSWSGAFRAAPLAGVTLLALALRAWGAFDFTGYVQDESFHVPSAIHLVTYGAPLTANWTHPRLGGLLLGGSIALFGDSPVGWRLPGVLLGTASVALLYLLAARLYRDGVAASIAALLLAMDPFHVFYSRSTMMETPVVAFFLLSLLLLHVALERRSRWILAAAGVALGLTAATKSYYVVAIPLLVGYAAWVEWRRAPDRLLAMMGVLCFLVVTPAAAYLLTYWHFFARGGSLAEFVQMQGDALWALRGLTRESFMTPWLVDFSGSPRQWFLLPAAYGERIGEGRYLLECNFFPLRPVALGAILVLAWRGGARRVAGDLAAPLLFAAAYLPLLALDRPVLGYSALAALPFAYLALGRVTALADARHPRFRPALVLGALVVAWGAYLYPLATGRQVSEALYAPVLASAKVVEHAP